MVILKKKLNLSQKRWSVMKKDGVQIHQEQPEQEQSFFQKHWKKSLLVELSFLLQDF
jgi:hypothetical protein